MKTLICLLLIIPMHVYCQEEVDFKGYVVYGEISGAGLGSTVNIESTFYKWNRWFVTGRIGVGYFRWDDGRKHYFGLPVGLNVFSHTGNSHKELGINITYAEGVSRIETNSFHYQGKTIYFIPAVGYRFQKPSGGLFLRVNYTPSIKIKEFNDQMERFNSKKVVHLFGVSAGYYFRTTSL